MIESDSISLEKMLSILDSGSELPSIFWTVLMRQETLLYLDEINCIIQAKWSQQQKQEIKIIENIVLWTECVKTVKQPTFPDLNNSIYIEGIYLQNLNKNPSFNQKVNSYCLLINFQEFT